jgi:hypothetical protein
VDPVGSVNCPVAGSCEYDDEPSGSVFFEIRTEFLNIICTSFDYKGIIKHQVLDEHRGRD